VFVETVSPGSNADKSGLVRAGDVLTACSATVLKVGCLAALCTARCSLEALARSSAGLCLKATPGSSTRRAPQQQRFE
jgi:hypothetical protein